MKQNLIRALFLISILNVVACSDDDKAATPVKEEVKVVPTPLVIPEPVKELPPEDYTWTNEASVECIDEACHASLGLLLSRPESFSIGVEAEMCVAVLIEPQKVAVSGCLPKDLAQIGSSCRNRIFVKFPAYRGQKAVQMGCESIEKVQVSPEVQDQKGPVKAVPNFAVIKLSAPVNRLSVEKSDSLFHPALPTIKNTNQELLVPYYDIKNFRKDFQGKNIITLSFQKCSTVDLKNSTKNTASLYALVDNCAVHFSSPVYDEKLRLQGFLGNQTFSGSNFSDDILSLGGLFSGSRSYEFYFYTAFHQTCLLDDRCKDGQELSGTVSSNSSENPGFIAESVIERSHSRAKNKFEYWGAGLQDIIEWEFSDWYQLSTKDTGSSSFQLFGIGDVHNDSFSTKVRYNNLAFFAPFPKCIKTFDSEKIYLAFMGAYQTNMKENEYKAMSLNTLHQLWSGPADYEFEGSITLPNVIAKEYAIGTSLYSEEKSFKVEIDFSSKSKSASVLITQYNNDPSQGSIWLIRRLEACK
jgi:hypothetical protein